VTDDLDQKAGSFIEAGDSLGKIVDRSSMKARILVRDWELEDVRDGARVRVKVAPFPFRTYTGSVQKILPAAAVDQPVTQTEDLERLGQKLTNYFAVEMEFANNDGSLREGMTGTARIAGKSSPLAWQFCRGAWRWAKSQIW
jgi:putative peptide zinc metalloprotease protein